MKKVALIGVFLLLGGLVLAGPSYVQVGDDRYETGFVDLASAGHEETTLCLFGTSEWHYTSGDICGTSHRDTEVRESYVEFKELYNNGTETSIIVKDNVAYVGYKNYIKKFNLNTGEEQWSVRDGDPADGDTANEITYGDGRIYVTGDGVGAYDAETGDELWRVTSTESGIDFSQDGELPVNYYNGTVYAGIDDTVLALEGDTGNEIWAFDLGLATAKLEGRPTIAEDQIIFTYDSDIYAYDRQTGNRNWDTVKKIGDQFNSPSANPGSCTYYDGTIFCGLTEGVTAYDPDTGNEIWENGNINNALSQNNVPVHNGTMYVADQQGWIYAFNTSDGSKLWETKVGENPTYHMILTRNLLMVPNLDNNFYAVYPENGTVAYELEDVTNTPEHVSLVDDKLYVGSSTEVVEIGPVSPPIYYNEEKLITVELRGTQRGSEAINYRGVNFTRDSST